MPSLTAPPHTWVHTHLQLRSYYQYRMEHETQSEENDILMGLTESLRSQLTIYVYRGRGLGEWIGRWVGAVAASPQSLCADLCGWAHAVARSSHSVSASNSPTNNLSPSHHFPGNRPAGQNPILPWQEPRLHHSHRSSPGSCLRKPSEWATTTCFHAPWQRKATWNRMQASALVARRAFPSGCACTLPFPPRHQLTNGCCLASSHYGRGTWLPSKGRRAVRCSSCLRERECPGCSVA